MKKIVPFILRALGLDEFLADCIAEGIRRWAAPRDERGARITREVITQVFGRRRGQADRDPE